MEPEWIEVGALQVPENAASMPMQQHPTYGAACVALGGELRQFSLSGGPENVPDASAQVLVRRWPLMGRAALLSRGPVWACGVPTRVQRRGLWSLLEQLRAEHRCVVVTPDTLGGVDPLCGTRWLSVVSPLHLARLDLDLSESQMRARMHGKWRNRLVRAEAAGLQVHSEPMPADPDHWLLQREQAQARTRGYRNMPPGFSAAWVTAGGAGSARLFTARLGRRVIAAMLFLRHCTEASYHIGWSGTQGRACGAHNLLLWRAMTWLSERGVRGLGLDLLDTVRSPGLARFKLGSGAKAHALGATRLQAPGTRLLAGVADRCVRPAEKQGRQPEEAAF